jgi:serine/threonine-protein kinase HipA
LSPAYDINPIPNSHGLGLNISETSNALDLDLTREVAEQFRVKSDKRELIIGQLTKTISHWREFAAKAGITRNEIQRMETAFI